jgi:hypothetical protein
MYTSTTEAWAIAWAHRCTRVTIVDRVDSGQWRRPPSRSAATMLLSMAFRRQAETTNLLPHAQLARLPLRQPPTSSSRSERVGPLPAVKRQRVTPTRGPTRLATPPPSIGGRFRPPFEARTPFRHADPATTRTLTRSLRTPHRTSLCYSPTLVYLCVDTTKAPLIGKTVPFVVLQLCTPLQP